LAGSELVGSATNRARYTSPDSTFFATKSGGLFTKDTSQKSATPIKDVPQNSVLISKTAGFIIFECGDNEPCWN
jgi:hypothetical protein